MLLCCPFILQLKVMLVYAEYTPPFVVFRVAFNVHLFYSFHSFFFVVCIISYSSELYDNRHESFKTGPYCRNIEQTIWRAQKKWPLLNVA